MNRNRLKELYKKEAEKSEAHNRIGIGKATLHYMMNDDNYNPTVDSIEKVAKYFGVPVGYFFEDKIELMTEEEMQQHDKEVAEGKWLTSKGEMLKNEQTKDKEMTELQEKRKPKGIPLIPVEAMAGYGGGDVQVMDYDIQEDYIITPELENKGIKFLIRASGSSMSPKYNSGDLLACRPITDISFMQWGKVYVLDTDQGPIVKRLYPNPSDEECFECRSDNFERYPPFRINKMSIRRIAIVVGVLRLE